MADTTRRGRRIRRAAVTAAAAAVVAVSAGLAVGGPADPDLGFGRGGQATIDSGRPDDAVAIEVQADGRVVVGGRAGLDPAAYRLNPDGSPDRTFGADGVKTLPTLEADDARAMAIQPDGRILLAGRTSLGTGNGMVARLNGAGGSPDPTFGDGGLVNTIDSGGDEALQAVAVAPDGRIVVAGSTTVGTAAGVYRLTAAGRPDTTFDEDGARGLDLGGTEAAFAAAVQPDGKVVIAGITAAGGTSMAFVARFTQAGAPDTGFGGGDGVTVLDGLDNAREVALQPDGMILLAGTAGLDMAVARVTVAGAPDAGFGSGGLVRFDEAGEQGGSAIALQRDGRVLVAGFTYPGTFGVVVHRLRSDGSRDPSFGNDGRLATGAGGEQEGDWALALQEDGRIVLAGSTETPADVIVLRLEGDRGGAGGGAVGPTANLGTGGPGPRTPARCAGRVATIVGTARADRLRGTARRDVIAGLGGADVIRGLAGDDIVCGGAGNDRILGGPGRDTLRGDAGRDRMIGGAGRDRLLGGAGRDLARQ